MNLSPLQAKANAHWAKYCPTMYKQYQEKGVLLQKLREAAANMKQELGDLTESGMRWYEAEEIVYPKYIYLPPEEDVELE